MKLRPKAVIPTLAVSGGIAAVLFGGTAVTTAFTSQSQHSVSVAGAVVNGSVTNGDFSIGGLTPGGPALPEQISFTNSGNTTEEAYVNLGSLGVTKNGANDQTPVASDLQVTLQLPNGTYSGATKISTPLIVSNGPGTDADSTAPAAGTDESYYTFDLGTLTQAHGQWLDVGTIAAGKAATSTVYVGLASSAGNSWNGASVKLPYTVQFQDTSGVDEGTGGGVKNLNGAQQLDDDHYVAPGNN
jgi:hypothetical protein